MAAAFVLVLGSACPGIQPDSGVLDPAPAAPAFTSVHLGCDGPAGAWTIRAETDAWSGGGTLTLSADGEYVELHPVASTDAALDGSSDHLEASLSVVADFRDVSLGGSTWFNCGTPGLQGLLEVRARDGVEVTDCRRFGADPGAWALWGLGTCSTELVVETVD